MFNHSVEYSFDGLLNRLIIDSRSDKWNIVVEDKSKEHEYERIFRRLLDDISKFKIFALGGKTQVIDAFTKISSGALHAPSLGEIYLLDGDFDFINMGADNSNHPSLIYLDRYDIENYLIDKEAIELFAQGKARALMEEVECHVDFTSWHQSITQRLYELFTLFYLVQKNDLGIENVGKPLHHFFDDKGAFKEQKYLTYFEEVKLCFENLHRSDRAECFAIEISTCKNIISGVIGQEFSRIISGKHYLWSIRLHLKSKDCFKAEEKDLRWWLINHFGIGQMEWLKQRILQIAA